MRRPNRPITIFPSKHPAATTEVRNAACNKAFRAPRLSSERLLEPGFQPTFDVAAQRPPFTQGYECPALALTTRQQPQPSHLKAAAVCPDFSSRLWRS